MPTNFVCFSKPFSKPLFINKQHGFCTKSRVGFNWIKRKLLFFEKCVQRYRTVSKVYRAAQFCTPYGTSGKHFCLLCFWNWRLCFFFLLFFDKTRRVKLQLTPFIFCFHTYIPFLLVFSHLYIWSCIMWFIIIILFPLNMFFLDTLFICFKVFNKMFSEKSHKDLVKTGEFRARGVHFSNKTFPAGNLAPEPKSLFS